MFKSILFSGAAKKVNPRVFHATMAHWILLWEELTNWTLAMKCKRESSRLWNKLPVFSGYVRFSRELLLSSKVGKKDKNYKSSEKRGSHIGTCHIKTLVQLIT